MKQIRYEAGHRFGKWTVLGEGEKIKGTLHWRCRCDCGTVKEIIGSRLRYGKSTSCGCNNIEKIRSVLWKGHGEIGQNLWTSYVKGAQIRNLCFDITIEQGWQLFLSQERKCALTGIELTMFQYVTHHRTYTKKRGGVHGKRVNGTASLDRIDSSKGYTIDNIQWVHKDINCMKMAHTVDYFVFLCNLVVKHNNMLTKGDSDDTMAAMNRENQSWQRISENY